MIGSHESLAISTEKVMFNYAYLLFNILLLDTKLANSSVEIIK